MEVRFTDFVKHDNETSAELIGKVSPFGSLRITRTRVRIPTVMADIFNVTIMPHSHSRELEIHAFFGLGEPNTFFALCGFLGRSECGASNLR